MGDLEFLADDHKFLNLQITRLMGLLNAFDGGRFERAGLLAEIRQQTVILQSELVEHFAYEEVTAFPHIKEGFPEFGARLQTMLAQHADVLEAFEGFLAVLNQYPFPQNPAEVLAQGTIFKTAFEQHTFQETQMLLELISASDTKSDAD